MPDMTTHPDDLLILPPFAPDLPGDGLVAQVRRLEATARRLARDRDELAAGDVRLLAENQRLRAENRDLRDRVAILEIQVLAASTPGPRRHVLAGRIRSRTRQLRRPA